jgi:hypothetical protein
MYGYQREIGGFSIYRSISALALPFGAIQYHNPSIYLSMLSH